MRGDIVFETADGSSVTSERMRLDSSGNLGIGNRTSSPDELLHVHTSSGEAKIHVEAATNARVRIRAHSGESIVAFADAASSNPGEINYTHSSDSMSFRTNGAVRATINSSGHLKLPYTPFFSVYGTSSNQTYNDGDIVDFENTSHNVGSHFKTTSGTGQFDRDWETWCVW